MTHRRKCLHNTCCAQYRLTNSRKTCTNAGDLQQFRTGPQEKHRHEAIGYRTPAEYADQCTHTHHPVGCEID